VLCVFSRFAWNRAWFFASSGVENSGGSFSAAILESGSLERRYEFSALIVSPASGLALAPMLQRGSKGRRSASRIYAREMVEVMIKAEFSYLWWHQRFPDRLRA
jgi:hypothetical protein